MSIRVFLLLMTIVLSAGSPLFSAESSTGGDMDFDDLPVFADDEGITITASPETTQQMRTVTAEEIQRIGAADLASLLEQTLDLPVTRNGPYGNTANVNIRGFGAGRVAILIDGIPVNSPQSGQFDIGMIDINSIERIEVIYGGSDTKYSVSGAIGGVINIITVKKQEPGIRLGGSISNTSSVPGSYYTLSGTKERTPAQDFFDAQKLSLFAAGGGEQLSWSGNIFANRSANHFLYKDFYDIQRRREHNEVYDAGADASFVWDQPQWLPELSQLILSVGVYYGDKTIPGSMTSRSVGKQTDFTARQHIMLDMPIAFRDALAMEAAVSHSFSFMDYTDPNSDSLHKTDTVTVINRWEWFAAEKLSLQAGGDYRFSYLDSGNIGVKTGHDGGVYLTANYFPVRELLIIPSVKLVFTGSGAGAVVPVPKLGLIWNATDRLALKSNWYRSFKYPSFNDLYWTGDATARGNPELKPRGRFWGRLGDRAYF